MVSIFSSQCLVVQCIDVASVGHEFVTIQYKKPTTCIITQSGSGDYHENETGLKKKKSAIRTKWGILILCVSKKQQLI